MTNTTMTTAVRTALTYDGAFDRRLVYALRVRNELGETYARDLLTALLSGSDENACGWSSGLEGDALFRTLVLDEGWSVDDAKSIYEASMFIYETMAGLAE